MQKLANVLARKTLISLFLFILFQELRKLFRLVIVSSRESTILEPTRAWVETHFPEMFEDIHLCNHFLTPEEEGIYTPKDKSDVCLEIGASILVDDSLHWAQDCSKKGFSCLFFSCSWRLSLSVFLTRTCPDSDSAQV